MGPNEKKEGFTLSSAALLGKSLARKLVNPVDKLRDLYTRLGTRPYRVRIIRTRWPSGRRGMGPEAVVHVLELLPTPKVVDLTSLSAELTAVGVNQRGTVQLQQISGRYTEDHLTGVDADGNAVGPNDSLYYEIESFRPDGKPADLRRFALAAIPYYDATGFAWSVILDSSTDARDRDGHPKH